jgi:hypothetical protein
MNHSLHHHQFLFDVFTLALWRDNTDIISLTGGGITRARSRMASCLLMVALSLFLIVLSINMCVLFSKGSSHDANQRVNYRGSSRIGQGQSLPDRVSLSKYHYF